VIIGGEEILADACEQETTKRKNKTLLFDRIVIHPAKEKGFVKGLTAHREPACRFY